MKFCLHGTIQWIRKSEVISSVKYPLQARLRRARTSQSHQRACSVESKEIKHTLMWTFAVYSSGVTLSRRERAFAKTRHEAEVIRKYSRSWMA